MKWERYAEKHPYFIDKNNVPRLLEKLLKRLIASNEYFSIIDLGCGEGTILYALYSKGLLKNASKIIRVDISEKRIKRLRKFCPFAEGVIGDVLNLRQIPGNFFDVAISSQVIEHVPDDSKMLKEVYRILRPDGYLYVSTVIKKRYGIWVYYEKGKGFKLDPTHVREYRSEREFLNLLKENGFKVIEYRSEGVRYPIVDLIIRFLMKLGALKSYSDFYYKHEVLRKLRKIKIPIIGYKIIGVVARKT